MAVSLVFSGCTDTSSSNTSSDAFGIRVDSSFVQASSTTQVHPVGGTPPYTFSLKTSGGPLGAIDSSSGKYSAPPQISQSDISIETIEVRDSAGHAATTDVKVYPSLSMEAPESALAVGNAVTLAPTGGVPPYNYSVVSSEGGWFSGSTYHTPISPGSYQVKVTDSIGNTVGSTVTVNPQLSISKSSEVIAVGNSTTVSPSGGVPPYKVYVPRNSAGVLTEAVYTAPTVPGDYRVRVKDSLGNRATAIITVAPTLAVSSSISTVGVNESLPIALTGGVPPYSYSVVDSGGGSFSENIYTAPDTQGTYLLRFGDSMGNSVDYTIQVGPVLALVSASIEVERQVSLSAIGGAPPYTYSVVSAEGGSVSGSTYTAPSVPGAYTVRVTDQAGVSADASVSVGPAIIRVGSVGLTEPVMTRFDPGSAALVLIDIWKDPDMDAYVLNRINPLIAMFRAAGAKIIHAPSEGGRKSIHQLVDVQSGDLFITRRDYITSSWLNKNQIETIFTTGQDAMLCVVDKPAGYETAANLPGINSYVIYDGLYAVDDVRMYVASSLFSIRYQALVSASRVADRLGVSLPSPLTIDQPNTDGNWIAPPPTLTAAGSAQSVLLLPMLRDGAGVPMAALNDPTYSEIAQPIMSRALQNGVRVFQENTDGSLSEVLAPETTSQPLRFTSFQDFVTFLNGSGMNQIAFGGSVVSGDLITGKWSFSTFYRAQRYDVLPSLRSIGLGFDYDISFIDQTNRIDNEATFWRYYAGDRGVSLVDVGMPL